MPERLPSAVAVEPRRCQTCDGFVDPGTRRVLGDDRGRVARCPNCTTIRDSFGGGAAGLETRDVGGVER